MPRGLTWIEGHLGKAGPVKEAAFLDLPTGTVGGGLAWMLERLLMVGWGTRATLERKSSSSREGSQSTRQAAP